MSTDRVKWLIAATLDSIRTTATGRPPALQPPPHRSGKAQPTDKLTRARKGNPTEHLLR
jgi:hypothetical protein